MLMLGEAQGIVSLDTSRLDAGVAHAMGSLGALDGAGALRGLDRLDNQLNRVGMTSTQLGVGLLGLGTAIAAPIGAGIAGMMSFEAQIDAVAAALGTTSGAIGPLSDQILQIGADGQYSANQIAAVVEELAKSGYSVDQIMGQAADGSQSMAKAVSDLASATGTGLDTSVNAITTAMATWSPAVVGAREDFRGMSIAMTDASRAADILTVAANASKADIVDIQGGMKNFGSTAAMFGIGFEDAAAAVALFTNYGLPGREAGTSLTRALVMLADPMSDASTLMNELGIAAFDASGNFIGLPNLMQQLQDGMSGMNDQAKLQALSTIFGAEAMDVMGLSVMTGAEAFNTIRKEMEEAGIASRQAAQRVDNLKGAVERMFEGILTLSMKLASGTIKPLTMLANGIDTVVAAITAMPGPVLSAIGIIMSLMAVAALASGAFLLLAPKVRDFLTTLRAMSTLGGGLGTAASNLLRLGGAARFAAIWLLRLAPLLGLGFLAYNANFLGFGDWIDTQVSKAEQAWRRLKGLFDPAAQGGGLSYGPGSQFDFRQIEGGGPDGFDYIIVDENGNEVGKQLDSWWGDDGRIHANIELENGEVVEAVYGEDNKTITVTTAFVDENGKPAEPLSRLERFNKGMDALQDGAEKNGLGLFSPALGGIQSMVNTGARWLSSAQGFGKWYDAFHEAFEGTRGIPGMSLWDRIQSAWRVSTMFKDGYWYDLGDRVVGAFDRAWRNTGDLPGIPRTLYSLAEVARELGHPGIAKGLTRLGVGFQQTTDYVTDFADTWRQYYDLMGQSASTGPVASNMNRWEKAIEATAMTLEDFGFEGMAGKVRTFGAAMQDAFDATSAFLNRLDTWTLTLDRPDLAGVLARGQNWLDGVLNTSLTDNVVNLKNWTLRVGTPVVLGALAVAETLLSLVGGVVAGLALTAWDIVLGRPTVLFGWGGTSEDSETGLDNLLETIFGTAVSLSVSAILDLSLAFLTNPADNARNLALGALAVGLGIMAVTGGVAPFLVLASIAGMGLVAVGVVNAVRDYFRENPEVVTEIRLKFGKVWTELENLERVGWVFQWLHTGYDWATSLIGGLWTLRETLISLGGPFEWVVNRFERMLALAGGLNVLSKLGSGYFKGSTRNEFMWRYALAGLWELAKFPFRLIFKPMETMRGMFSRIAINEMGGFFDPDTNELKYIFGRQQVRPMRGFFTVFKQGMRYATQAAWQFVRGPFEVWGHASKPFVATWERFGKVWDKISSREIWFDMPKRTASGTIMGRYMEKIALNADQIRKTKVGTYFAMLNETMRRSKTPVRFLARGLTLVGDTWGKLYDSKVGQRVFGPAFRANLERAKRAWIVFENGPISGMRAFAASRFLAAPGVVGPLLPGMEAQISTFYRFRRQMDATLGALPRFLSRTFPAIRAQLGRVPEMFRLFRGQTLGEIRLWWQGAGTWWTRLASRATRIFTRGGTFFDAIGRWVSARRVRFSLTGWLDDLIGNKAIGKALDAINPRAAGSRMAAIAVDILTLGFARRFGSLLSMSLRLAIPDALRDLARLTLSGDGIIMSMIRNEETFLGRNTARLGRLFSHLGRATRTYWRNLIRSQVGITAGLMPAFDGPLAQLLRGFGTGMGRMGRTALSPLTGTLRVATALFRTLGSTIRGYTIGPFNALARGLRTAMPYLERFGTVGPRIAAGMLVAGAATAIWKSNIFGVRDAYGGIFEGIGKGFREIRKGWEKDGAAGALSVMIDGVERALSDLPGTAAAILESPAWEKTFTAAGFLAGMRMGGPMGLAVAFIGPSIARLAVQMVGAGARIFRAWSDYGPNAALTQLRVELLNASIATGKWLTNFGDGLTRFGNVLRRIPLIGDTLGGFFETAGGAVSALGNRISKATDRYQELRDAGLTPKQAFIVTMKEDFPEVVGMATRLRNEWWRLGDAMGRLGFGDLWREIKDLAGPLADIGGAFGKLASGDVQGFWTDLQQGVADLLPELQDVGSAAMDVVRNIDWAGIWGGIQEAWGSIDWPSVGETLSGWWSDLTTWFQGLPWGTIWDTISTALSAIPWGTLWDGLKQGVAEVWTAITGLDWAAISAELRQLGGPFQLLAWAIDAVRGSWNWLTNIINNFKAAWGWARENIPFMKGPMDEVAGAATNLGDKLKDLLQSIGALMALGFIFGFAFGGVGGAIRGALWPVMALLGPLRGLGRILKNFPGLPSSIKNLASHFPTGLAARLPLIALGLGLVAAALDGWKNDTGPVGALKESLGDIKSIIDDIRNGDPIDWSVLLDYSENGPIQGLINDFNTLKGLVNDVIMGFAGIIGLSDPGHNGPTDPATGLTEDALDATQRAFRENYLAQGMDFVARVKIVTDTGELYIPGFGRFTDGEAAYQAVVKVVPEMTREQWNEVMPDEYDVDINPKVSDSAATRLADKIRSTIRNMDVSGFMGAMPATEGKGQQVRIPTPTVPPATSSVWSGLLSRWQSDVSTRMPQVVQHVQQPMTQLPQIVRTPVASVGNIVRSGFASIAPTVTGAMSSASAGATLAAGGMRTGVMGSVTGIRSGVTGEFGLMSGGVAASTAGMAGTATGNAASMGAGMTVGAQAGAAGVAGGMLGASVAVIGQSGRWPGIISGVGGAMAGTGASVGAAASFGVARGLEAGIPAIIGAANRIVAVVNTALRAAAQIASPSRLMAREVGLPMTQGIVEGMTNHIAQRALSNGAYGVINRIDSGLRLHAGIASPAKRFSFHGLMSTLGVTEGLTGPSSRRALTRATSAVMDTVSRGLQPEDTDIGWFQHNAREWQARQERSYIPDNPQRGTTGGTYIDQSKHRTVGEMRFEITSTDPEGVQREIVALFDSSWGDV